MTQHGGDFDTAPAEISVGEWEHHRGLVARALGICDRLEVAVKALSANVNLLSGTVTEFRRELREQRRTVAQAREDSSSDLRIELERYQAAERQRELESYRAAAKARWAWALDLAKILVAGVAGGVLAKLLHL